MSSCSKQRAKGDPGALVSDADPDRAIFVVDAQGDDRTFEARIGHSRHRQEQFAGQETRLLDHANDNGTQPCDGQGFDAAFGVAEGLRPAYSGPKARLPRSALP